MITKRDQTVLNFIEDFHIATAKQIYQIFFNKTSYRYCNNRLLYLYNQGFIKRSRSTIDNGFAYYINKKPIQVHHDLIRSGIYVLLNQHYSVEAWQNEYIIENIRPDAFCLVNDHDIVFPCFIEVHLNNKFNFEKYQALIKNADLKAIFKLMPRVVIVTDRDIVAPTNIGIKFKIVNYETTTGIDNLFRGI
ncbi:hypothetical protein [Ruminiclostridium papyrosolvens]|uniref:Replication-relaxation n=1 Tax=Ruminiclostridium papyrosolvens C7 TaxID=1330534 RepID=U4R2I7_9FIRM|nr:hypothetical protein [Ruminiclostridium papyrosolvens]EPR12349.1 hypothetical protein L323_08595 [Ruminiclostridium papyrosolvens C7]